jgi:ribonucleoside-diphosphate reductase alpha chain
MGILRVDHPDVEEFVRAKQNDTSLRGFNISLAVTDAFMHAVDHETSFELEFKGRVHKTVDAAELWEKIMRSTWDYAEPGVVFIDTINRNNNLWYCETIASTNPCSEQPLPPFGACLLGSFNLVKYLQPHPNLHLAAAPYYFDGDLLVDDIPSVVRGLDNVVDRTRYPLAEQKAEALSKRRMGIGVMGLANAAEACGFAYGSTEFLEFEEQVLRTIEEGCYAASVDLAREKGAFPLFDAERYAKGAHIQGLSEKLQDYIMRYGIRNSHLTSIAPTGTISLCADNVSGGLEPVFSYELQRQVNSPDGPIIATVEDYGSAFLGTKGKLAAKVTADEHIAVLAMAQRHVDSAVSKTVNMTSAMPWQDFKDVYRRAWELGCKGCATFNADGKRGALLVAQDDDASAGAAAACYAADPVTGQRDCG